MRKSHPKQPVELLLLLYLLVHILPAAAQESSAASPIVVPPLTFVDINSGRLGKLEISMQDAQFLDAACDKLYLQADRLDLAQGQLQALEIDLQGGHFQDFTIDRLTMVTKSALRFDTGMLLNHRLLQFTWPASCQVTAVVRQESLNRFLNSPRTLNRLSVASQKKAAFLSNFLGDNNTFGATFQSIDLSLSSSNQINVNLQTRIGVGQLALPMPFELNTRLELKDGWVTLGNTRLQTNGQEISPELAQALVSKVNSLANWGSSSDDINFSFTDLKVLPGDRIVLKGTAELYRLRF